MGDAEIRLRLPTALAERLLAEAQARGLAPGRILCDLLERELAPRPAKRTHRADEPLVARLQRLLAPTMAEAGSWDDLSARLARHGHALRPAGGGLTLHDAAGRRLCKSSELGFPYARFVRKFGVPMPGHPHRMAHLFVTRAAKADPDDPVLIEPF